MGDHNAFQQMQDEMSRFEAEISGGDIALVSMAAIPQMRPIIGVRTFGAVQQRLDSGLVPPPPPPPALLAGFEHPGIAPRMFPAIPPPPPPPSMMVPHQVQRSNYQHMPFMRPNMSGPQRPPLIPPPPPKPQPVILSAAPKLYKQPKKDDAKDAKPPEPKKKKKEPQQQSSVPKPSPLPPPATAPAPPAAPAALAAPATPAAPHAQETSTTTTTTNTKPKKEKKNRKVVRMAGGQTWEDVTLLDWPDDDFRMFCGDLGNDVTDELLTRTFGKYTSFQRAKVIRDKRTNKSKGFGFVSFKEPSDFIKAMKEMDGRYVGSRPIKLRKSNWKNRSMDVVKKKDKEKAALLSLLMSGGKC